jgi:hypothetical protein
VAAAEAAEQQNHCLSGIPGLRASIVWVRNWPGQRGSCRADPGPAEEVGNEHDSYRRRRMDSPRDPSSPKRAVAFNNSVGVNATLRFVAR